ncbi:MAG: hypothetical protein ACP5MD_02805, partial [Verrucomicrobiia bacterium]
LMAEHLSGRFDALKGRTVEEIDREYRETLGFPVPTHVSSVTRAMRSLCKDWKISLRHQRGNYCGEDPPLSETEILTAEIDDPFQPSSPGQRPHVAPIEPPAPLTPQPLGPTTALPALPPGAKSEPVSILPQPNGNRLRQEIAARLQSMGAAKILRAHFTVFLQTSAGDLSAFPSTLRGSLSGPGNLTAEINLTKEGQFTKGQIEQMAESLPAIPHADYQARLEVLPESSNTGES